MIVKQPKKLIKDVTFGFAKEDTKCGPHIAYTLACQGGAASGKNQKFLFKADESVSEEVLKAIQDLGLTEVNKDFGLMQNKQRLLELAIKKQYADDDEWVWVMDFNESTAYFCGCKGVYAVGYEYDTTTGDVTLSKLADKVVSLNMFKLVDGKMKLSEMAEDQIEEGVLVVMEKALQSGENFEDIETLKGLIEKGSEVVVDTTSDEKGSGSVSESNVNVERPDAGINKNKEEVMDIQELLKSQEFVQFLEGREADIQKAADARIAAAEQKAEALEKAAKQEKLDRLEKSFTSAVEKVSFIKEEDRVDVVKGLVEGHDNATILKMFDLLVEAEKEIVKVKSEFATTEHGVDGEVASVEVDGDVEELIKSLDAKFAGKEYL